MKNSNSCRRWANQYSKNLSKNEKEELTRHTETCLTCYEARKAYEEYQLVHKALQTIPQAKPLPNITFQQLLAQEQVRLEENRSSIRKRGVVFAAFYGLCAPIAFYAILSFIWLQMDNPFKMFSNIPPFPNMIFQTLVIYAINVITCQLTKAFSKTFCSKTYKSGSEAQSKGLLVPCQRDSDVKLYIRLTRQIGGIVAMCLSLVTSVIFVHPAGILPVLVVGLVPHLVSPKKQGKTSRLRVQAIFWGIVIEPHSLTQSEHSIPLLRLIADTKKSLQWV